jgi:hypothetical protein
MKVYEVNLKFIESSINFNMTILENKIKNFQIFFKEFLKLWVRCTFQAPSFLDLKGDVRPKLIIIIIIEIIIIIIIIIIIDFIFKIKIYVFFYNSNIYCKFNIFFLVLVLQSDTISKYLKNNTKIYIYKKII